MDAPKPLRITPAARQELLRTFTGILETFVKAEEQGKAKKLAKNAVMGYGGATPMGAPPGGTVGSAPGPMAMAEGDAQACPECGSGKLMRMGSMHGKDHFICRGCGEDVEHPAKAPVAKALEAGSGGMAPGQATQGAALGKAWRAGGPRPTSGTLAPKQTDPSKNTGQETPAPPSGIAPTKPLEKRQEMHAYAAKRPGATGGCKVCGEAPGHTVHAGARELHQLTQPAAKTEPVAKSSIALAMRHLDAKTKSKAAAPAPAAPPAPVAKSSVALAMRHLDVRTKPKATTPATTPAAKPMEKAGPPPVPAAAGGQRPALAGAKIPPRIPGSALGGKLAPTKLPGMTPAPGAPAAPKLEAVRPSGPRAPTMGHVKVPGKSEPMGKEEMCKGCGHPHLPGEHPSGMDPCALCGQEGCDGRCRAKAGY